VAGDAGLEHVDEPALAVGEEGEVDGVVEEALSSPVDDVDSAVGVGRDGGDAVVAPSGAGEDVHEPHPPPPTGRRRGVAREGGVGQRHGRRAGGDDAAAAVAIAAAARRESVVAAGEAGA
jgi:hypothetical protein